MTAAVVLCALVVFSSCLSLGGGLYEALVVDPVWPGRPAVVQPRNGGLARNRFWIPAHLFVEATLVAAVFVTWGSRDVRIALLTAVTSHVVMRVWSLADLEPKSVAFEGGDPATIDRAGARRWTRRSMLRLPLHVITCGAAFAALVLAA